MRVMVLVKATDDSEASTMPSAELLEAMGKFNEELINAGILLDGQGLQPSVEGQRVAFDGPSRTVIDGPFAETGELVAGFWLWEVKDMDEAEAWVKRCPNPSSAPVRSRSARCTKRRTSAKRFDATCRYHAGPKWSSQFTAFRLRCGIFASSCLTGICFSFLCIPEVLYSPLPLTVRGPLCQALVFERSGSSINRGHR